MVFGGDFNVIRYCHEKSPPSRRTRSVRLFDELIRELELRDLALHNASFTWSNFREEAVKSRLDRFLFTEEWGVGKNDIRQETGSRTCSDHMPIILDTSPVSWGPSPFRFENMWLEHSGFRQECEQWWRGIEVEGWESYRIMEKLRALKDKIQVWNKEVFGDTRIIKKEVVEKIAGLDKKEEMTQLDVGERELRLSLRNQLEELVFKEAVAWRQKMEFRWIKEWDYNSAMFHRMVSFWKSKNIINRIVKEDETVLTDQREIVGEIVSFFENLYKEGDLGWWDFKEINWGRIAQANALWLERPFEEEEIKKAVFEIDREKSPGPDGYTGAFFQDCWGILKNDMVKIFEEFHRNGKVCGNMNHTFLCLIPKKLDVQQVNDFRPISLISGVYKILAKLLANRLREVLEETISMTQGAFVHNR